MNLPDADEIILGEVIAGNKDFLTVDAQFCADDFRRLEHRLIFLAMADLHQRRERIDRITVANELMKHNALAQIGGLSYIVQLSEYGEYKLSL